MSDRRRKPVPEVQDEGVPYEDPRQPGPEELDERIPETAAPYARPERPLEFDDLPEETPVAPVDTSGAADLKPAPVPPEPKKSTFILPQVETDRGVPFWVILPQQPIKYPRGRQIVFLKFRSSWTDAPWKGSPILDPRTGKPMVERRLEGDREVEEIILWRQCICWTISVGDKKNAMQRSMGDQDRAIDEMTRQFIRVVDGEIVDWGVAGAIDIFWNDLGEKCRGLIQRIFNRMHVLSPAETVDFLANCVAIRSSGA